MIKFSPGNLLVAAALFGIAAESAWSQEATTSVPGAAAEQTTSSATVTAPGYAPTPYSRRYEPYWQPPPWPEPPPPPPPPPGYYGQYDPYYPPYRQNRTAPAAPAVNPLSAELKRTQEQLAGKTSELDAANEQLANMQNEQQAAREAMQQVQEQLATKDTELNAANEQLANLQAEQQAIRDVMQQAQSETAKASEQLNVVIEEMDILYEVLSRLKGRLDVQNTSLLGALQADSENGQAHSAVGGEAEQVQTPAKTPAEPKSAGGVETEAGDKEMTKP